MACTPRPEVIQNRTTPEQSAQLLEDSQALMNRLNEEQDTARQQINSSIAQNPTPASTPLDTSAGTSAMTKQAARSLIDPNLANDSERVRQEERSAAIVANTTVGKTSWLLDKITNLAYNFTNKLAHVESAILKLAGMEGNTASSNKINTDIKSMAPLQVGVYNYLHEALKPYENNVRQLARRWGISDEEAQRRVGMYGLYEHFPERQRYLIDEYYPEEIRKVDAAIASVQQELDKAQGNVRLTNKYTAQLAALDQQRTELNNALNELSSVDSWESAYHVREDGKKRRALTSGMSTAEAIAAKAKFLSDYNITKEEIAPITQQLRDAYKATIEYAARKGLITKATLESFPKNFNFFLPVKSITNNRSGLVDPQRGFSYNVGRFHNMEGTRDTDIADGYSSVIRYMQRVAIQEASRPVGMDLIALHNKIDAGKADEEQFLYVFDMDDDLAPMLATQGQSLEAQKRRDFARGILGASDGFALGVDVTDPADPTKTRTKIITFNPSYKNKELNIDGALLNRSMNLIENQGPLSTTLGTLNAKYTSLFTHWNPAFAAVNSVRDGIERLSSMAGQSYELEDGKIVDGSRFLTAYLGAMPKAANGLLSIMRGVAQPNSSPIMKYWAEYVQGGLKQDFTPGRDNNALSLKRATELPEKDNSVLAKLKNTPAGQAFVGLNDVTLGKIDRLLTNTNDYFNNLAPFAQYIALRESGVTAASARIGTLELMNLRERGHLTGALRALFPFAKPTIQGAKNLFRTIGLTPNAKGEFRPNIKGLTMIAGELLAFGLLASAARASLGEDDEGRSNFDLLPIPDIIRGIPFDIGDNETFKLATGFGWPQIAGGIYLTWDRVSRGLMTPEEGLFTIASTVMRNVQPADLPNFAMNEKPVQWLVATLSPPVIRPAVETAINVNSFGGRLTYGNEWETTPMSLQGRMSTPSIYHKMAVALQRTTGFDVAPEQMRNILEGYTGGLLRIFPALLSDTSLYTHGIDKSNAEILGPWLTALGVSSMHGTYGNNNLRQYYQEWGRTIREIKRLGIDITNKAAYGGNSEKREEYQRKMLEEAGLANDVIDRFFIMQRASKEAEKLSSELKASVIDGPWFDNANDDDLKERFKQFGADRDAIFERALQNAGYI